MAAASRKSRKRSAASSRSPPEVTLFIDRSLGQQVVAQALREVGAIVETHDQHFAVDAPDEAWLREAGARGWAVLTKDRRIRYRKNEKAAVVDAKVRLFVLTAGNLTGGEMAAAFVQALPRIRRLAHESAAPFIARVDASGHVRLDSRV